MDFERLKNDSINVKFDSQLRPDLKISQVKDIIFESENDREITFTLFYGGTTKTITFDKTNHRIKKVR